MSAWENPYYSPEKFGLHPVATIEWSGESYQFDMTVVWYRHGQFYWSSDSGCSCPSPFEDVNRVDELDTGSAADAIAYILQRKGELETWAIDCGEDDEPVDVPEIYAASQVVEAISSIREQDQRIDYVIQEVTW